MTTDAFQWEEKPNHPWMPKCWGEVQHVFNSPDVGVSVLKVVKGFRCSRHYHQHRANKFLVVSGSITVHTWLEDDHPLKSNPWSMHILRTGDILSVQARLPHMFVVRESGLVIEVYTPGDGPVDVDDIARFDEGGPV